MQYVTKSKYLSFICSIVHAKVEILLPTTSSKVFPDMLEALESSQVPMMMRAKNIKYEDGEFVTRSMSLTSAKVKTRNCWACLKSASASQQWMTSSSRLARWSTHRSHCQDLATRKNYHKLARTKMGWQEWVRREQTLGHLWTPRLRPG